MAYSDLVEAADRAAMFALGGEVITYASSVSTPTGAPVQITGIFDSQFVLAKGDGNAGVEATAPAVFFRFDDLPVDPEIDEPTLTIRGIDYRVIERIPDDMGGIVLVLRTIT